MKIGIVGVGYVGAVTGVCFAYVGHRVVCFDVDENKIGLLKQGKLPIYEPGLEHYLGHQNTRENITFTVDLRELVDKAELIFLCIGTPSQENGDVALTL